MNYKIEEIEKACNKVGLSKSLINGVIANLPNKRSLQENKALHVLFQNISYELNEQGREFIFKGLKGIDIGVKYTPKIVKDFIWKPLEMALLDKSSTTELTNSDIKLIFENLEKWFAEQGVQVYFPSVETLELKKELKNIE